MNEEALRTKAFNIFRFVLPLHIRNIRNSLSLNEEDFHTITGINVSSIEKFDSLMTTDDYYKLLKVATITIKAGNKSIEYLNSLTAMRNHYLYIKKLLLLENEIETVSIKSGSSLVNKLVTIMCLPVMLSIM